MVRLSRLLAGSAFWVGGRLMAAPALAHHSFAQFRRDQDPIASRRALPRGMEQPAYVGLDHRG
jgi:hypothetical protein